MRFPFSRHKDPRHELLARMPDRGVCAEIGVWKGDFSETILDRNQPARLNLVDPWLFVPTLPCRWYGGAQAQSQHDMDMIHQGVVSRFARASNITIHRKPSAQAVGGFPDRSFDWIYIDGDHSYKSVLEDLRLWSAKVKPGGYLAGDDFDWKDESDEFSVRQAVEQFAREGKLRLEVLGQSQFFFEM